MSETTGQVAQGGEWDAGDGMSLVEFVAALRARAALLLLGPIVVGAMVFGVTYLIAPTFTASTTFMPPQQAQNSAALALASLGPLAGLAGNINAASSSAERYVALMQSASVSDRLIDQFKLMEEYEARFRVDARMALADHVHISVGKKDGLITVEVDDKDPQRAANLANQYVSELRRVTDTLAVTEAQQRRVFFERHLQQSRDRLAQAQQALEGSGFNLGSLKAEPKAAADAYARIKADATAAELKLKLLGSTLADDAVEIRQQRAALSELRSQLANAERTTSASGGSNYIDRYREYKYQEALFDIYARQFELARADESREGALIQVIDHATTPEKRSRPKRVQAALLGCLAALLVLATYVVARASYLRQLRASPVRGEAS